MVSDLRQHANTQNGIVLVPLKPRDPYIIECDSSKKGGGAYSPSHYYMEPYTQEYAQKADHINALEALNLVHALKYLMPPQPQNYQIIIIGGSRGGGGAGTPLFFSQIFFVFKYIYIFCIHGLVQEKTPPQTKKKKKSKKNTKP